MMTQEKAIETATTFLGKVMRVNVKGAKATLKNNIRDSEINIGIELGARTFEVCIIHHRDMIKLSEVYTRKRFAFDPRNPLSGFGIKQTREIRFIKAGRLSDFYPKNPQ